MTILLYFALSALFMNPINQTDSTLSVSSPSENHTVVFELQDASPFYSVSRENNSVIERSSLGFKIENESDLTGPFEVGFSETTTFDETWTQVWGEKKRDSKPLQ